MYLTWRPVALIVALIFGDAFAIALSGQKFTVTPDKRQAQDLVRNQRLESPQFVPNSSEGYMG